MKFTTLFLGCICLLAVSCETTSTDGSAQLISLGELTSAPGYAWFPAEMNTYTPSSAMVDSVNKRYQDGHHKIYVFVKPSCSCRGTQKLFPQIIKTLDVSNIDMSRIEIWSMRNTTDHHPHGAKFMIDQLPSIYVTIDDVMLNQIADVDYNESNADTLIANALLP